MMIQIQGRDPALVESRGVGDVARQLQLMVGGLAAAVTLAIVGLNFAVTPSYELITRPTPTPTTIPFSFGDPRLASRNVTLKEAAAYASFKILRPAELVNVEPDSVVLSQYGSQVVSVRQTYALSLPNGAARTSLWLTQAPGGVTMGRGFPSQAVTRTVSVELPDGNAQEATLATSGFGLTLSWTNRDGYFSLRVPPDTIPAERLIAIANSLR